MDKIQTVRINSLSYGGQGIGKLENGKVVFVSYALPEETVKIEIIKKKKSFAIGRILEIIEPSEKRIEPLCSAFGKCGGCVWQNIPYEEQAKIKESQVREIISHQIELKEEIFKPIIKAVNPWRYRNKIEFSYGMDKAGQIFLGLFRSNSYKIIDLDDCFLTDDKIKEILKTGRNFAKENNLTVFKMKKNEGLLRSLIVRYGFNTQELMINLVAANSDLPTSHLISGKNKIKEKIDDLTFLISPESFFQSNTNMTEVLLNTILNLIDSDKLENIYDLFCGTGIIGLFIAGKTKKPLIGIESNDSTILDAKENAELNQIGNTHFITGEVEKAILDISGNITANGLIIVDPPRVGLHPKALKVLTELKSATIIYVSCNPTTLARDLAAFVNSGFKIEVIQPIDMFPQTYHIETIVKLT
ncbi:MAG: 23S rRNA (uracil(1939)-C(5))-methyltransferase RlmD [Actinobacteria bacterium]|nr:23S rRNA (uracil(1939)-C(5))-methyltransferase RlmD [Actinomycetota bacterium]